MGHSGGSTSTPSEPLVMSNHSGDSKADAAGHDSAAEEDKKSPPRKVLGKRRGEQLATGDRSAEKKGVQMCC